MKKPLGLVLLSFSITATADISADLRKCSRIVDNSLRLSCFDQVTEGLPELSKLPTDVTVKNKSSSASTEITPSVPKSLPVATINVTKEDAFGKTNEELVDLDNLKSQIDGEFKGWQKGAIITLKNGQTWKVMSRDAGYVNFVDPLVKIEKGIFGSYTMTVEGLNASAKVRRVD